MNGVGMQVVCLAAGQGSAHIVKMRVRRIYWIVVVQVQMAWCSVMMHVCQVYVWIAVAWRIVVAAA